MPRKHGFKGRRNRGVSRDHASGGSISSQKEARIVLHGESSRSSALPAVVALVVVATSPKLTEMLRVLQNATTPAAATVQPTPETFKRKTRIPTLWAGLCRYWTRSQTSTGDTRVSTSSGIRLNSGKCRWIARITRASPLTIRKASFGTTTYGSGLDMPYRKCRTRSRTQYFTSIRLEACSGGLAWGNTRFSGGDRQYR